MGDVPERVKSDTGSEKPDALHLSSNEFVNKTISFNQVESGTSLQELATQSGQGSNGILNAKSLYSVSSALQTKTGIGLFGCICIIIGSVLGSGIFAAPQEILHLTGSPAVTLVVWFTYGLIALIAALCYVELGCTFPVSGGDYAYLNECFGSCPAFLLQWSANFVVIPVSSAIMASVVAKNLVNPYVDDPTNSHARWATCFLAMALIMGFAYVNSVSTKLTEKVEGGLMIINIITITLVVSCGIAFMAGNGITKNTDFRFNLPKPEPGVTLESGDLLKFQVLQLIKALYQSSFSYFGYSYLNNMTEELENPLRNLPLGICISIPIIIFLNVFVNFCYLATLPEAQIMNTQTIASDMLRAILPDYLIGPLSWLAPTLVAIAVSGGLTSNIMACSRISFTGARNGHFPTVFATLHHERATPVVSIAWIGLLSCLYTLIGNIPDMIAIATYLESTDSCLSIYGLIYTRFTRPDLVRPIKMPIFLPITYAIIASFLFFVPIFTLDKNTAAGTLPGIGGAIFVVFTGFPIYFLFIRKQRKWKCLQKLDKTVTVFIQKLWMVVPDEKFKES